MTKLLARLVAPLVLLIAQMPAPAARPEQAASAEAETVATPFNPPLDTPLRYRLEQRREGDSHPTANRSTVSIQFARRDDGFRMTVTPLESDLPVVGTSRPPDELTRYLTRPYFLNLSADGEITGMEDAPGYWNALIALIESQISRPAPSENSNAVAASLLTMLTNMPPEVRLALLTRSYMAITEFVNVEMAVGERVETSIDTPSPAGGTFRQDLTVALERVADGRAHFAAEYRVPRDQLEPMVATIMNQIGGQIGEAYRTGNPQMSRTTAQTSEVSMATGLTERYRSVETLLIEVAGQQTRRVTTRILERID